MRTTGGSLARQSHRWGLRGMLVFFVLAMLIGSSFSVASGKEVTLKVLHCWDAHRTAWVNEMFADFMKANLGIKVEGQLAKNCGTLNDEFVTSFVGGVAPDLVMLHSLDIAGVSDRGALEPLDAYMQKDGVSRDAWYPSELGTANWHGRQYGFPIRTGGDANTIIYYNKTVFDESGLDSTAAPDTWDEWLSVARKLTRYDGDKIVRAGTALYGGDFAEVGYLYSGGGKLFSDDGKQVTLAGEEGMATAEFVRTLGDTYGGGWAGFHAFLNSIDANTSNATHLAFGNGRLAIHPGAMWEYSYYQTNMPKLEFGIGVRPSRKAGGPAGANAGTFHWTLVSASKNKDAVWQLLKWISLREETGGYFMLRQGRPSPVRAFNLNKAYFDVNPDFSVVGKGLSRAATIPQFPFTRNVLNTFVYALGDVAFGTKAPKVALTEAASQAQGMIDEYWKNR